MIRGTYLHGFENPLLRRMKVKRLRDLRDFVGRRYERFRVRDIRGRNVMVKELRDVYVQSVMWR